MVVGVALTCPPRLWMNPTSTPALWRLMVSAARGRKARMRAWVIRGRSALSRAGEEVVDKPWVAVTRERNATAKRVREAGEAASRRANMLLR